MFLGRLDEQPPSYGVQRFLGGSNLRNLQGHLAPLPLQHFTEQVQEAGPSPTNTGYVNHMLATASRHGLGPTAAALLPCPWTYHMLREEVGKSEHLLYGQWTSFYVAGFLEGSVEAWRSFVDRMAHYASPAELDAMRQAFLTSSRYEYMFWDAAYRREQWPL